MISFLTPYLGKLGAKIAAFVVIPLLILGGLYLLLDAYGDAKYSAGVSDTDAKYAAASAKLHQDAANARDEATKKAAVREAEGAAKLIEEKEKIDEAVASGGDPFDVLFPSTNSM